MGCFTSTQLKERVGPGWLPLSHAEAIQSVPEIVLVGVCDQSEEVANRSQQTFNVPASFTDHRELIDELSPDILSVATRTDVRAEIIQHSLSKGIKAIYAEKPVTLNLATWKQVRNSLETSRAIFSYGTNRRYMPIFREARKLIRDGAIGQFEHIHIEHGRAPLLWSHPHSVDLILFFAEQDQIDYVSAQCSIESDSISNNRIDSDPLVESAFVQFQAGLTAHISTATGMNVRLSGTEGTLTIVGDAYGMMLERRFPLASEKVVREFTLNTASKSGTQIAFEEIVSTLNGGEAERSSLDEIELGQKLLFGFALSALEGGKRWELCDIPLEFTVTGRLGNVGA